MNDIISKLNILKSVKPEENWVIEARKRVLSEAPVFNDSKWKVTEINNEQENKITDEFFSKRKDSRDGDLSRLGLSRLYNRDLMNSGSKIARIYTALFSKKLAVSAFSFVFIISGSVFTIGASKSSLPGDAFYPVKIAGESVILAITSGDEKAEVEMQQVGKRLEEFNKISKNYSDPKQGEKIEMLLGEIEVKTNKTKEHLTKIEDSGVKARVAKVINTQTEKYTEVLTETNENLTDVMKDEVSEKLASASVSNERLNFDSLAMMVETIDESEEGKEEITAKIKEKIDKLEEKILVEDKDGADENSEGAEDTESNNENDDGADELTDTIDTTDESSADVGENDENLVSEAGAVEEIEKAKEELEKAKVSLESDNLSGAMEAIINVNISVDLINSEKDSGFAGNEPIEEEDQDDENGEVEGVSGEIEVDEGEDKDENEDLKEDSL